MAAAGGTIVFAVVAAGIGFELVVTGAPNIDQPVATIALSTWIAMTGAVVLVRYWVAFRKLQTYSRRVRALAVDREIAAVFGITTVALIITASLSLDIPEPWPNVYLTFVLVGTLRLAGTGWSDMHKALKEAASE